MKKEITKLIELAKTIESWADKAERGGWSTQNIVAMREEAKKIYAFTKEITNV